jgi:hypothetical protein
LIDLFSSFPKFIGSFLRQLDAFQIDSEGPSALPGQRNVTSCGLKVSPTVVDNQDGRLN